MAISKDIRLRVLAETRQFQAEMAKIPGTTEKQAAAAARKFAREMIRAEREAANAATRTAARAASSVNTLGTYLERHGSKVDRILSRLSPLLATIDPQLASVAYGAGDAAAALRHLEKATSLTKVSMGSLVVVLAALGAAYFYLKKKEDEAKAAMERASEAATKAQEVFGKLSTSTRSLADEVRLATGQIDELGLSLEKRQAQLNRQYTTAIRLTERDLEKLRERKAELIANRDASREHQNAIRQVNNNISRRLSILEELKDKQVEQTGTLELLTEHQREEAQAAEDAAAADEAKAKAAALRKQREAELAEAIAHVAQTERSATMAILSPLEQKLALYDEEIARLDALDAKYGEQVDTSLARAAMEKQLAHEVAGIRAQALATLQQQQDEAHRERMTQIQAERNAQLAAAQATGQVFGNLSAIAITSARNQAEAGEEGAQKSLETAKKLAAAEVAAATAVGLINAVARNAGRPIATAAAILAVLTTSAASAQQIAGLSLHTGGIIEGSGLPAPSRNVAAAIGPGEQIYRNRVVLQEERVLSPEATRQLGEEGARKLERGGTLTQPVYVPTYKHFDRFMQDELRRDGTLTRAIGRDRTTGQRGVY